MKALVALLLVGCSGAQAQREACYAKADATAAAQAAQRCGGTGWEGCDARPDILAQLKADYRRCP